MRSCCPPSSGKLQNLRLEQVQFFFETDLDSNALRGRPIRALDGIIKGQGRLSGLTIRPITFRIVYGSTITTVPFPERRSCLKPWVEFARDPDCPYPEPDPSNVENHPADSRGSYIPPGSGNHTRDDFVHPENNTLKCVASPWGLRPETCFEVFKRNMFGPGNVTVKNSF